MGVVDLLKMKAIYFDGPNGDQLRIEDIPSGVQDHAEEKRAELIEILSEVDDDIGMDNFMLRANP